MLVKVFAAAIQGISATPVTIEVNALRGIQFFLVGLPDSAVKESYHRIQSALQHNGMKFPSKQIIVNMAPADIRKEGSAYDLPIAIGILAADGAISAQRLGSYMIMGELGLDGSLVPVKGVLPIALKAQELGYKGIILPEGNAAEAAVVNSLTVYSARNLQQVVDFLNGKDDALSLCDIDIEREFYSQQSTYPFDFSEVRGQESVKRAFEVAAAGGHNLLMVGPPGSGKSMMAKRLPSILPPLTLQESLETTKIHSVSGHLPDGTALITQRPFRSPHHTVSSVALCGGGANPRPGEISLAHNGVLFLDELPEFSRDVLEVMRQPLEDRKICVARANYKVEYPAGVMFVASMNPCPCGYYNHPTKPCVCNPGQVQRYLNKISGPLLDRIDLQIEIVPVPFEKISDAREGEPSAAIRERVIAARKIQEKRYADEPGIHCNAQMPPKLIKKYAAIDTQSLSMLKMAMERFNLSARAYDRILKVARTIADLEASEQIQSHHIGEAISYRNLDRESWGT
ncbi:MAG: YifB family Mg chelatase-like AAA ATPase [Bacteroidaceae bacterium]|nr:YifB family Mg chelatase-like AAA ATPase [Bacteroidaceae bacterium]